MSLIVYLIGISSVFSQIHHQFEIRLQPDSNRIDVVDTLTIDESVKNPYRFSLHKNLIPKVQSSNATLKKVLSQELFHTYELTLESETEPDSLYSLGNTENNVVIQYQGVINQALQNNSEEYARSFNETTGIISNEGVFLSASSYWYPVFENELVTFNLTISLPNEWRTVSQGHYEKIVNEKNTNTESWSIDKPQQEIYLIAAKFYLFQQDSGSVKAQVYLRSDDSSLAQKYLDVTSRYITMYSNLIAKYPYHKFALVENFWETGYGMPSFTLLGSKVIRLPFILHSSYPHEIVHNWWGNSVYVNTKTGNWSEGLTSYLADHLIKEQRGQALAYRRAALQKYTDFVQSKDDFPLSKFRSRFSAVTEAVGYGKTLMLFHMLRTTVGDKKFKRVLKQLYAQQVYKVTGYKELNRVFTSVTKSNKDKKWINLIFKQWVNRKGAPELKLENYNIFRDEKGFRLTAVIRQTQKEAVFSLDVPLAITLQGKEKAYQTKIRMIKRRQKINLLLPSLPLYLDIDPEFDIFRRLDSNEIPPSINQVFSAKKLLILLPSKAPADMLAAYQSLATTWQQKQQADINISLDKDITTLPRDRAVWLLGWENLYRNYFKSTLTSYPYKRNSDDEIVIHDQLLSKSEHSVIVVARHKAVKKNKFSFAWLATNNANAVPGLARKLPHYGKYSYLAFTGDEPNNMFKGQWPVVNSPMSVPLSKIKLKVAAQDRLKTRKALATLPPAFSQNRMLNDIHKLANQQFSGRGLNTTELDAAADFIQQQFQTAGLQAAGDRTDTQENSYFQQWQTTIDDQDTIINLKNIIAVIPGSDPMLKGESLIIAAHYDHLGLGWPDVHQGDEGKIHPGADDNASGVAVMLEVARLLAKSAPPKRSIIFIAFTAEESGKLGSQYYIDHLSNFPKDKIIAMLNLDTVGRLHTKSITVFGNNSASEWVHIFRGVSYVTGIAIKPVNNDLDSSDHISFLDVGVPAIQFFSGANLDFHRPSDTSDKIDAAGLVKIATVLKETIDYLSNRTDFLTSNLAVKRANATKKTTKNMTRRVTLGTVPDFQYSGTGVRIESVIPGSPAAKANLQKGDILVKMNNVEVTSLRVFATVLRTLKADDVVSLSVSRNGVIHEISTNVVAR